jgi:hypothetical protein
MALKRTRFAARLLLATCLVGIAACCSGVPDENDKMAMRPVSLMGIANDPGRYEYDAAVAAIDSRDYGLALKHLQTARTANPNDVRVLNAFGVVYDKLGRFDLSARYYDQALRADPGSQVVLANVAYSKKLAILMHGGYDDSQTAVASIDTEKAAPAEVPSAAPVAQVTVMPISPLSAAPVVQASALAVPDLNVTPVAEPGILPVPQQAIAPVVQAAATPVVETAAAPVVQAAVAPEPVSGFIVSAAKPAPVAVVQNSSFIVDATRQNHDDLAGRKFAVSSHDGYDVADTGWNIERSAHQLAASDAKNVHRTPRVFSWIDDGFQYLADLIRGDRKTSPARPSRSAKNLAVIRTSAIVASEQTPTVRMQLEKISFTPNFPGEADRSSTSVTSTGTRLIGHPLSIINASGLDSTEDAVRNFLAQRAWALAPEHRTSALPQRRTVIRYTKTTRAVALGLANTLSVGDVSLEELPDDADVLTLVLGTELKGRQDLLASKSVKTRAASRSKDV